MKRTDNIDERIITTKTLHDELKKAILNTNPEKVEEALKQGANPNDKTRITLFSKSFMEVAIDQLDKRSIELAADQLQIKEQMVEERAKQVITILLDYGADISILNPYRSISQALILKECAHYLAPKKAQKVLKQVFKESMEFYLRGNKREFEEIRSSLLKIEDKIIENFVDKLKSSEYVINLEDMELIKDIHQFPSNPKANILYQDLTSPILTKIVLPTISAIVNKNEPSSAPHEIIQKLVTRPELTSNVLSYLEPQDIGNLLATIHPGQRITNLNEQLEKVRPEAKSFIKILIEPIIRSMQNAVKQEVKSKLDIANTTPADLKALEIASEFRYFDPEFTQLNRELSELHLKTDLPSDELQS